MLLPEHISRFVDSQRDAMIALIAVIAGTGGVLLAVAAGKAGSNPHYNPLIGGLGIAAWTLIGVSQIFLLMLVWGRESDHIRKKAAKLKLSALAIDGSEIVRQKLEDDQRSFGIWFGRYLAWNKEVESWLAEHLSVVELAIFTNDIERPASDIRNWISAEHRDEQLRLSRRIQNLHRIIEMLR